MNKKSIALIASLLLAFGLSGCYTVSGTDDQTYNPPPTYYDHHRPRDWAPSYTPAPPASYYTPATPNPPPVVRERVPSNVPPPRPNANPPSPQKPQPRVREQAPNKPPTPVPPPKDRH